ncbi:MAG: CAP domain-containing protein [Comamonadaceae bacterium]|nr:MAG: CAP domain-containing protein [Comamonadaceae bacterium]
MTRHPLRTFTALALASVLSACGGGGGGDADDSSAAPAAAPPSTTTGAVPDGTVSTPEAPAPIMIPAPAPAPAGTSQPADQASTAPRPTYAQGSEELAAFDFLNAERGRCGFGLLAQNTKLDAAAKAHADYQLVNNLFQHTEDRASYPTGFTGTTPWDRFAYQGYTNLGGGVDQITGISGTADKAGFGVQGIRNLLNAPYHLKGLMAGMREMGVSVRSSTDTATAQPRVLLQYDAAYTQAAGPQNLSSADVQTYPCDGSAGVNRQLTNESPAPVPGRNLQSNPLGTSVYFSVRSGNALVVDSVTMTDARTGSQVALRGVITSANDPNREFLANEAYVAADAPLAANTSYQVTVTGTNNGTSFSRTFTFTTGS